MTFPGKAVAAAMKLRQVRIMRLFRKLLPVAALLAMTAAGQPGLSATPDKAMKEQAVTEQTATGTFEVSLKPLGAPDAPVGALSIDKTFHGDLEATSLGQMLAVSSAVPGSAGYVAMERVNGTLGGRTGSFALQHSGTMNRGAPTLSVTVVPDSGTGELVGLSGAMTIDIQGGVHSYGFRYRIAP
jgi:hypothetical protein